MEDNAKAVTRFHGERRIFAFIGGEVTIAPTSVSKSHEDWLRSLGYSGDEIRSVMENNLRGYIDLLGDIYIYRGYDFGFEKTDEIHVSHLVQAISKSVSLSPAAKVFGGVVKGQPGEKWPGKREVGKIRDFLLL